jgi:hypothetical protein
MLREDRELVVSLPIPTIEDPTRLAELRASIKPVERAQSEDGRTVLFYLSQTNGNIALAHRIGIAGSLRQLGTFFARCDYGTPVCFMPKEAEILAQIPTGSTGSLNDYLSDTCAYSVEMPNEGSRDRSGAYLAAVTVYEKAA